jgi:hypothetical protein
MKYLALIGIFGIFAVDMNRPAEAMPPGLSRTCQGLYVKYDRGPGPKAFAMGLNGACGYSSGTTRNTREASARAMNICRQQRGRECEVVDTRAF